jgi:hypothetical protein
VVAEEWRALRAGEGVADVAAGLQTAAAMIEDARSQGWRGPVDVWIFSDLQRVSWAGAKLPGSAAEPGSAVRSASPEEAPPRFLVVDCTRSAGALNLALGPLSYRVQREVDGAERQEVSVALRHLSGDRPSPAGLAQLWVDGRVERSLPTEPIQPGGQQLLRWDVRLPPGYHVLEVRVQVEDALAADNRARRLVLREDALRVALFAVDPRQGRYAQLALAPQPNRRLRIERRDWSELGRIPLDRFDLWMLCDPPPPTAAQLARIEEFRSAGGGVVWGLGPRFAAGSERSPADAGWVAQRVVKVDDGELDPLEYGSPITAPFAAYPGSGLLTLPVFRLWDLELGEGWEPVLALRDAERGTSYPLVVSREAGRAGRAVIFATPWGPGDREEPWNALIAWPAFVPLLQESAAWAGADPQPEATFQVGQFMRGVVDRGVAADYWLDRDGQRYPLTIASQQGEVAAWNAGVAARTGTYYWPDDAEPGRPAAVVNFDLRESDLQHVAAVDRGFEAVAVDDDQRWAALAGPTMSGAGAEGTSSPSGVLATGAEISWWFLLLAIAALCGEAAVVRFVEGRF